MRPKRLVITLALLAAYLILMAGEGRADTFTFSTSGLSGYTGPFFINFQFTDGNSLNNTAILTTFMFGGGSPSGLPITTPGASGDLSTMVTLDDSTSGNFLIDFGQQFTPGSFFSFDLTVTGGFDNTESPDQFTFGILDGGMSNIFTTDAGGTNKLLILDIGDGSSPQQFRIIPAQTAIPEPATLFLLGTGLAGTGALFLKRRKGPNSNSA